MEINFNKGLSGNLGVRQETLDASQVSHLASGVAQSANHLTITQTTASPEDIAAAGIPDAALSRDDALGRLVGEAFNLPPPPMPDFASNP